MHQDFQTQYLSRLESRKEKIDRICRAAGAVGLSCGVICKNGTFTHHFGHRDRNTREKADDDTIYAIGSLTKAFTAMACAICVHDGKLEWNKSIKEWAPHFKLEGDGYITDNLTLEDILCQRSGLADPLNLWLGKNNEILIENDNLLSICNNLPIMDGFRTGFRYNNFLYSLAGQIAGKTYNSESEFTGYMELLEKRIFKPLKLTRTCFDIKDGDKNLAKPYAAPDDYGAEPYELPYPGLNRKTGGVLAPCGGIRSSLKDMLSWTDAVMKSTYKKKDAKDSSQEHILSRLYQTSPRKIISTYNHQRSNLISIFKALQGALCFGGKKKSFIEREPPNQKDSLFSEKRVHNDDNPLSSVLEDTSILLEAHNAKLVTYAVDREESSLTETSYALGWCRQNTPTKLSLFTKNRDLLSAEDIPLIGKDEPSRLIFSHIGSLPGFNSVAIIIPELHCSIVVLTNTDASGDAADWVTQFLLETIINPDSRTNFESLAQMAAGKDRASFNEKVKKPYKSGEKSKQHVQPAEDFVGCYVGLGGNFRLVIEPKPSPPTDLTSAPQLIIRIADKESQSYDLSYYDVDCWGFLPGIRTLRAEAIPYQDWKSFILRFQRKAGEITGLYWKLEGGPEDCFFKRDMG